MPEQNAATAQADRELRMILRGGVCALIAWAVVGFLPILSLLLPSINPEAHERLTEVLGQWGTFGDMFNCLNVLFSGGAFLGVIYTVILQRREMQEQQEELALAKKERIENRKEMKQTALLNALSQMAQIHAIEYSGNADKHDKQHGVAGKMNEYGADVDPDETLKGSLQLLKQQIAEIISEIRKS